jgi:hypothetical protein
MNFIKNIALKTINKYMKEKILSSKEGKYEIGIASINNSPLIFVVSILLIACLYEGYYIQLLLTFTENNPMKISKILIYICHVNDEQYYHYIFKESLKDQNCVRHKKFCFNLLDNDFISISKENIERNPSYSISSLLFQVQNFLCAPDILKSAFFNEESNKKVYFSEEKNQKKILKYKKC